MKYYITPKAWDKIISYAKSAYNQFKTEIGGMAVIYKTEEGNWIVDAPCIMKQEVSSTNTALNKENLAKYYTKTHLAIENKHKDLEYRFLWWHSHHTMEAFWSGTDLSTIEEYSDGDIGFALVVNCKGEYKFRVSVWNPVELSEDITLHKLGKEEGISEEINKEVKEHCEKESAITSWTNNIVRANTGYNQTYLWEQEQKNDEHEDTICNLASYDHNLSEALELLSELSDSYIEGVMKYPTMRKKLKEINKKCDEMMLCWRVKIPSKNEMLDVIMHGNGTTDLIELKMEV